MNWVTLLTTQKSPSLDMPFSCFFLILLLLAPFPFFFSLLLRNSVLLIIIVKTTTATLTGPCSSLAKLHNGLRLLSFPSLYMTPFFLLLFFLPSLLPSQSHNFSPTFLFQRSQLGTRGLALQAASRCKVGGLTGRPSGQSIASCFHEN